jgi:hypothetical protein
MTRKSMPMRTGNTPVIVTDADTPGLPAMVDANQLASRHRERQDAARRVALEIGYELPGGAPDPELIVRDIATHMRRSVEECLEIGRALLVLKEACEHGEFMDGLASLNFDHTLAKRFMQAARKFSNGASTHHLLEAAGTQTKLLELLVLDDEQVEELELTGQTGELHLDDVACMSVSELRKAVRGLRNSVSAKDKVAETNQQTIQKLQEQLAESGKGGEEEAAPAPASFQAAQEALDKATLLAMGHAGPGMMAAIDRLCDEVEAGDDDYNDAIYALISTSLRRVFAALKDVARRYDVGLVSQDGDILPDEPADIDIARMESLRAAARADEDENVIDVE